MRLSRKSASLTILLFGLLVASSAVAGGVKARGSGHFTLSGELRTFSFTARLMPDGTVQGMGNIHNRTADNHVKFEIDCLRIDGHIASMHGQVTLTTVPEWEDAEIWFRAIDNGEGAGDPPDELTQVGIYFAGPAPSCAVDDAFVLGTQVEIEGGNIQVSSD